MVEHNTILFLFNQNDKTPKVNDGTVSFTFGAGVPSLCEYPLLIDKDKNLFEMGCNCHYIDYDTNIINIDCTIPEEPEEPGGGEEPKPPSCIYWEESLPGYTSFDCPCIPYEPNDESNVDFVIDCTIPEEPEEPGEPGTGGTPCIIWKEAEDGETPFTCGCIPWDEDQEDFTLSCKIDDGGGNGTPPGTPVILNFVRNHFGFTSNITFSIDIMGVNSAFGFYTTFEMSVANMRIDTSSYFGLSSSFSLARTHTINVSLSAGYAASSLIVYDPYHKFFNDGDSTTAIFGQAASSVIVYNPYHKFSEYDLTIPFGWSARTSVLYDPFNKLSEVDIVNHYGADSKAVILYNPYHKFSDHDLTIPFGVDSKSTIVYNPYHKFSESDLTFAYGIDSKTFILFNQFNKLSNNDLNIHAGFESKAFVLFDQFNKLSNDPIITHFGYESKSVIIYNPYHKLTNSDIVNYYGVTSNTFVLFDQFNTLSDKALSTYYGVSASSFILFDQYHPFTDEDIVARFGYAPASTIVYDPYHEFFKNKTDSAISAFGFTPSSWIVYNPYHEFFKNKTDSATINFGMELKGSIIFNPYNKFNEDVINPFIVGYDTKSSIRYNDDHRISPIDINLAVGIDSKSDMKLANIYANVSTTFPYGFESNGKYQYHPGFVTNSYFGIATNIKYLTARIPFPTFGICITQVGYELHSNTYKPRYFDLSAGECCTINKYEMIHIEMTDFDDWDVLYGNENGWGIACIADLCAQPRMSANMPMGYYSEVIDNTVYLGQVEIGFGMKVHTRGLQFDTNIELGNGNFITDQNEIKVELTKPDDIFDSNYVMGYGTSMHTNFGATYGFRLNDPPGFGQYVTTTLRVDEALRGSFTMGYNGWFALNNTSRFTPRSYAGFALEVKFYEPPYYMYHTPFAMHCEAIITQNWVEFLEEGELDNEYLFQTKNGDIDESRPNGVSLEGYPFTRYIKGRCY